MAGIETTTQSLDGEPRRWSDPVRIGELIAEIRAVLETHSGNAARQNRMPVSAHPPLRKAG